MLRSIRKVGFLTIMALTGAFICAQEAVAKDRQEVERSAAIASANKMFYSYVIENFGGSGQEITDFAKISSKMFFDDAAVWQTPNGYMLYKVSNPMVFLLPSRKIMSSSPRFAKLYGLPPSYLLKITGKPAVTPDESFLKLGLRHLPDAIKALHDQILAQSEDQFKVFLDKITMDSSTYMDERMLTIKAPFLRTSKHQKCLSEIDWKMLTRSMKADLINGGMGNLAKDDFAYADFIPISGDEAILLSVVKNSDGLLYALSSTFTNGKCRYGGKTEYVTF